MEGLATILLGLIKMLMGKEGLLGWKYFGTNFPKTDSIAIPF